MVAKKPILNPGDVHVIINDWERRYIGEAKCYTAAGTMLWNIPALCKGVEGNGRWDVRNGDTPPGLYLAGLITETRKDEPTWIWNAYGRWCIDMVEQQGQEESVGRAGICWHGGGTAAPIPLANYQQLVPTLGCVRSHNLDLEMKVVPLLRTLQARGDRMWITVNQFD